MSGTKVFWLEPTQLVRVTLRVFRSSTEQKRCAAGGDYSWCEAPEVLVHDQAPMSDWMESVVQEGRRISRRTAGVQFAEDDPRWPVPVCLRCNVSFADGATRQVNARELHSGCPDGKLYTLWDQPIGAMWDCAWFTRDDGADYGYTGRDGITLCVKTPGGDWLVDSQASNCTRNQHIPVEGKPNTTRFTRTHYCWVRHGDPRTGNVHVDKDAKRAGVETCSAGAGSILCGSYHGFLHNGFLTAA